MPEDKQREFIIEHLPVMPEILKDKMDTIAEKEGFTVCGNCNFDMGENYENCGASEDGVCPECGNEEETDFLPSFEGTFEGREYEVIDRGLSGNGDEHWRKIRFKDNGEEKAYHKSVLKKKAKL